MTHRPLILVVNDDGIHAPGLKILAETLRTYGDVVTVAPHVERSASAHAITITQPLRAEKLGPDSWAIEGSPVDCVMVAFWKLLKRKPDWVCSGINRGGNLGIDTLYSGTVGAALEAALHGVPALAVSCQGERPLRYEAAAKVVTMIMDKSDQWRKELGHRVLNINVPSGEAKDLKGLRFATLGRRLYDQNLVEGVDPRGRPYFWIGGGGESHADIPDSDCIHFDDGYATLSVLHPSLFDEKSNRELKNSFSEQLNSTFRT